MEFESAIKKNLWIFLQKYGVIKKIEPFHSRMEHNIIQMTAIAGLTVPHSSNPFSSFQMKAISTSEAMSISKIIAFGAQRIQTSSMRSQSTHNEWLFGADFGTVASSGHFSSKMKKEPLLWSMASVIVTYSTNFCFQKLNLVFIWYIWYLVWTGRGHLSHSQRNNRSFAHRFWKSKNQPKFWCQWTTSELRFFIFFQTNV